MNKPFLVPEQPSRWATVRQILVLLALILVASLDDFSAVWP